jgi:hypothetical protein
MKYYITQKGRDIIDESLGSAIKGIVSKVRQKFSKKKAPKSKKPKPKTWEPGPLQSRKKEPQHPLDPRGRDAGTRRLQQKYGQGYSLHGHEYGR